METIEIILFAAEVAVRWAWSAKVGHCIDKKNPAAGQTELFQRKPICHEIDGRRIILWKEGKKERKFQIIIPSDPQNTIGIKTMAEIVGKTVDAGARLWEDIAIICDTDMQVSYKETAWRDWNKNGRFFDKEYSVEMAIVSVSLKSWSPSGKDSTFTLIIQKEEKKQNFIGMLAKWHTFYSISNFFQAHKKYLRA